MKERLTWILAMMALTLPLSAATTPQYPGGKKALDAFIKSNMKYPASAKANGMEGVVTVRITVMPDSTVKSAKVLRLVDPDLEKEALRIVKAMPRWIPADKDGKAIEATADVSIAFSLGTVE